MKCLENWIRLSDTVHPWLSEWAELNLKKGRRICWKFRGCPYHPYQGWPFWLISMPQKGSFLAWLKRKPLQKRKSLFVSDTHDNDNVICQQNSKVNKKKTASVYILWKKDWIVLCLRPSFGVWIIEVWIIEVWIIEDAMYLLLFDT